MRVGASFCPGILHAVPAKDGMLVRIRVPGGLLQAGQLGAVAAASTAFADGRIEITSRANLQLRAIPTQRLPLLVEALSAAGLLPSPQHDRVRNLFVSPFTGLAADELIDSRPLIRELDERLLAEPLFAELHPKFSFAIDGGGKRFSLETDDLALRACKDQAESMLQLFVAGVDTGLAVSVTRAVDCLLEAARACIQIAKELGVAVRAKTIAAIPSALERLLQPLSHLLEPSPTLPVSSPVAETPLGICPERAPHHVSVVPSVPLGRLTAKQATHLSDIAAERGADLRLAPWRGVVFGAVPKHLAISVAAQLESVALWCDGRDGFHGIAACAGSTGCDAALADVRSDAALLAQHLAVRAQRPGWTVNFSGCEKQCAMRQGATAELIATPSGYSLRLDGQLSHSIHSPESALQAILSARSGPIPEVAL